MYIVQAYFFNLGNINTDYYFLLKGNINLYDLQDFYTKNLLKVLFNYLRKFMKDSFLEMKIY